MEMRLKEGELTQVSPNTDEVQLSKPITNLYFFSAPFCEASATLISRLRFPNMQVE